MRLRLVEKFSDEELNENLNKRIACFWRLLIFSASKKGLYAEDMQLIFDFKVGSNKVQKEKQ